MQAMHGGGGEEEVSGEDPSGPISYISDAEFKKIIVVELYTLRKDLGDLVAVTRKILRFLEQTKRGDLK